MFEEFSRVRGAIIDLGLCASSNIEWHHSIGWRLCLTFEKNRHKDDELRSARGKTGISCLPQIRTAQHDSIENEIHERGRKTTLKTAQFEQRLGFHY